MIPLLKTADDVDYSDCVVTKPWGYEFQVFDNRRFSLWLLYLKAGHSTSLHCHLGKMATFIPLIGTLECKRLFRSHESTVHLQFPRTATAGAGIYHSVGATDRDLFLMEYETPSNKSDIVRMSDRYGRVGKGYEGEGAITREDLGRFGHFEMTGDGAHQWNDFTLALHSDAPNVERGLTLPCGDKFLTINRGGIR